MHKHYMWVLQDQTQEDYPHSVDQQQTAGLWYHPCLVVAQVLIVMVQKLPMVMDMLWLVPRTALVGKDTFMCTKTVSYNK